MEGTNGQRATDADNYHYFAHDTGGGVSGIAGLGTVCRSSRRSRTAITEWIGGADSHYAENQCVLVSCNHRISLKTRINKTLQENFSINNIPPFFSVSDICS